MHTLPDLLAEFGDFEPDPFVPELQVFRAADLSELWKEIVTRNRDPQSPMPFWGVVWPGGRAMARYFLDRPELVRGRRVLDLATGSGIIAVAAARVGAKVTAMDIDRRALAVAALTARRNRVRFNRLAGNCAELTDELLCSFDLIVSGDVFYEEPLAAQVFGVLRRGAGLGIETLVADPGRAHRPQRGLTLIERRRVPVFRELENVSARDVEIWRVTPADRPAIV